MVDFFGCKKQRTRGTLGYIRNPKTEQNKKAQKQHWIIKPKNRYYFLQNRKPDARKRKICKPQRTPKPKNRTDLK